MVYLIFGSPCSGKSHYIKEQMQTDDLVCDVDDIYSAISGNDAHDADLYVHEVALELRQHLLDIIRDRKGGWKNAFVPSIANTAEQVRAEAERIKADEIVFIDIPYEVCMERAKDRPDYFRWLIAEWFESRGDDLEQCADRTE